MRARILVAGLGLLAMAGLGAGCTSGSAAPGSPTPLPVITDRSGVKAEGRLEPVRYVEMSPAITGLVSEVLVSEGENVAAGQLIATLDSSSGQGLEAARNHAGVELGNALESLRIATRELDAHALPRVFVGLTAEEAARTWLAELDGAREAFEPYEGTSRKAFAQRHSLNEAVYPSLPRRVLVDTNVYDEVAMVHKKRLDVAWMNYTKAVQWLTLDATVARARARVDEAQRRFESLQDDQSPTETAGTRAALASAEIRAPFAGIVTRQTLKVGEVATAGVPVVTVADLTDWIVRTTDLTEIDVTSLRQGGVATIILDAAPEISLPGRVLTIDLTFTDRQGDILYPVDVLLGESPSWLRWGMTAEVTFGE
jgi:multidrug resistance efflux pump